MKLSRLKTVRFGIWQQSGDAREMRRRFCAGIGGALGSSPAAQLGGLTLVLITVCVLGVRPTIAQGPNPAENSGQPTSASPTADGKIIFNRDVRPILADACFHCHGPDAKSRKGDVRLDQELAAVAGDNPVIVPGKPDESSMVQRIMSSDDSEIMPPPETNKRLTDEQKSILTRWIAEGAQYQKHWSFEPIVESPIPLSSPSPDGASPTNSHANPIDAFLAARIQAAGLEAQPPADRETLIRRVALTLTGLPPTPAEIDTYLQDNRDDAYEAMVDRYLESAHFGEEMARHWLDVARYADTHGLHLDNERQMWVYRDWVVSAFNQNLPFDQFTIWQIAGDQLPNPTMEQLIATGFNRCNVTTSEGGAIDAEFTYRYAVERTTAVAQAWLGLTAGCAVCHDHKYDPITMREFYSLYAFFYSAADPAMDGNINTTAPFLKVPDDKLRAVAEAAGRAEQPARGWLNVVAAQVEYHDPFDEVAAGSASATIATSSTTAGDASDAHSSARQTIRERLIDEVFPLGSTARSTSRNAVEWTVDPGFGVPSGRRAIRQAKAGSYTDTVEFKLRPVVTPHDAVIEVWVRVEPLDTPQSISLSILGGGSVTWTRVDGGLARQGSTEVVVKPGEWTRLAIPAAELKLEPGSRINGISLNQEGGIAYWDAVTLTGQSDPKVDPLSSFAVWRKFAGAQVPPDVPSELHGLFRGETAPLNDQELQRLRQFYVAVVARPVNRELAAARDAWETARAARIIAEQAAPGTFIFRDLETPRESFVMLRGQYDKPGEKVEPGVPAILPAIAKPAPDTRLTRLDLARWLVSIDNPLTARVIVNRFWQQVYGTGLVKTSYDFGSQGTPPSHPELLDWLAWRFRDSGWDTKAMMKLLVTTDAFRRSAKLTDAIRAVDPANRLYARGPRIRLDAEQVRDNALFVSGLLQSQMGGRGVNPYQPPNIWEPVGYSDSNTRFYLQDHGANLYRRSLYVFLKRTAPPPFMSNFDAPNREQVCTVRERSNTPLQALQLMNDVQHFEAARALAERLLVEASTTHDRISLAYRLVLARQPDADERQLIEQALNRQRELYASDPSLATKAIHVGESQPRGVAEPVETAAWTMIANLMLNLDETVNRN